MGWLTLSQGLGKEDADSEPSFTFIIYDDVDGSSGGIWTSGTSRIMGGYYWLKRCEGAWIRYSVTTKSSVCETDSFVADGRAEPSARQTASERESRQKPYNMNLPILPRELTAERPLNVLNSFLTQPPEP
jgi:hypothetical protein